MSARVVNTAVDGAAVPACGEIGSAVSSWIARVSLSSPIGSGDGIGGDLGFAVPGDFAGVEAGREIGNPFASTFVAACSEILPWRQIGFVMVDVRGPAAPPKRFR